MPHAAKPAEEGSEAETSRIKGPKKDVHAKDEKPSPNLILPHPAPVPGPEPKAGDQPSGEGEGLRAEGSRSSKRAKEDPGLAARIQIVDQRRIQAKPAAKAGPEPEPQPAEGTKRRSAETRPEEGRQSRDLSLDLLKPGPMDKGTPSREGAATAAGQNFSALLADRLRDSGNTEIVQSARILLKDGDAGTIRMRLNPPELGNVKIELHLADNSISGRIVVDSDAARSAFEKGMAQLQDAFRSGGFESARLEVQVGSGDAGGQGAWNGGGRGAEGPPEPFWSERSRSAAFEASSPSMSARPGRAERALDIVV